MCKKLRRKEDIPEQSGPVLFLATGAMWHDEDMPAIIPASWVPFVFLLIFLAGTGAMLVSYRRMVIGSPRSRQERIDRIDLPQTRELRVLAYAARFGHRRDIDVPEAERLLQDAYSRGDKLAGMQLQRLLQWQQGQAAAQESERIFNDCRDALLQLVSIGHPEANYLFCNTWNMQSLEEPYMTYESESLFEACAAGFVPAWLLRAEIEADPDDGSNPDEAFKWYSRAADEGWLAGRTGMAGILCDPQYSGFDPDGGISMLRECAVRNDSHAMRILAHILLDAKVGRTDPEAARQFLAQAVKLGEYHALIDLAILHRDGIGGSVDIEEARRLLKVATRFSVDREATELLRSL